MGASSKDSNAILAIVAEAVGEASGYSSELPTADFSTADIRKTDHPPQGAETTLWSTREDTQASRTSEETLPGSDLHGSANSPEDIGAPPVFDELPQYEFVGVIGKGGMGEVYRVRDRSLDCVIALKVMQDQLLGDSVLFRRFVREAQVTAQLDHPGVVPVHNVGRLSGGRVYFTMKEVRGRTLSDVITDIHSAVSVQGDRRTWGDSAAGWTFRRLMDAFFRVCETVAYAHDRGIIHRDLKPSNVMVGNYGEVYVVDWGLAKILGARESARKSPASRLANESLVTSFGEIAGTLSYMPPEQGTGRVDQVGKPADVYALGVILFQILTGRLPFGRTTVRDFLEELERAPEVGFEDAVEQPEELLSACTRALSRNPLDRQPDAASLGSEISLWLEGARRRARALEVLEGAEAILEDVQSRRREAIALRAAARSVLTNVPRGAPIEAKRPGWELEDRADGLERSIAMKAAEFTEVVRAALTHAPDLPEARRTLARHYAAEHREAESAGDTAAAIRAEAHLREVDIGDYAAYLKGDGTLTLYTDPAGAKVEVYRYDEVDRRFQPQLVDVLGPTPVRRLPLSMGSYLLILKADGRIDVRYPVEVRRNQDWSIQGPGESAHHSVYLPEANELSSDERYVAAGWFVSGGESARYGARSMLPRRRLWLDGFAIRANHVTIGEYAEFLNELLAEGRDDVAVNAAPRAPGLGDQLGAMMLARDGLGPFFIPENNVYGIPWQADWPVIFVDWHGASAYAQWLATRRGLSYRLPSELEWEKAARGVDGRLYPWGNHLDPTFARMLETHLELPTMAPAGTYPVDESPYAVRDMAGNQRDWCIDVIAETGPPVSTDGRVLGPLLDHPHWDVRVTRGGNFLDSPIWCWANYRSSFLPHVRDYTVSFRTARSLGPQR